MLKSSSCPCVAGALDRLFTSPCSHLRVLCIEKRKPTHLCEVVGCRRTTQYSCRPQTWDHLDNECDNPSHPSLFGLANSPWDSQLTCSGTCDCAALPRIASAVFHLGYHVQKNRRMGGALSEDQMNKICETIEQLNILPLGESCLWWIFEEILQGFGTRLPDPTALHCIRRQSGILQISHGSRGWTWSSPSLWRSGILKAQRLDIVANRVLA